MTTQTATPGISKFVQAGLIGGVIATVINLILWFVGNALSGGAMQVVTPFAPSPAGVPWPAVIISSLLPGIVAGLLYGLLARFTNKATTIFLVISLIVFIAFIYNPISAGQNLTTILVLEVMHVFVALPVIWFILRTTRQ
jgi:hypothetical protein